MKMKRAVMMAVLVLAIAALALPMVSLKARAAGGAAGDAKVATSKALATASRLPIQQQSAAAVPENFSQESQAGGSIDKELLRGMGVLHTPKALKAKAKQTNIATSPQDAAVVRTVIALGRNLNLEVVAEGVETEEQARLLRTEGCDLFQGYLFSPPVTAEAFGRMLRERKGGGALRGAASS